MKRWYGSLATSVLLSALLTLGVSAEPPPPAPPASPDLPAFVGQFLKNDHQLAISRLSLSSKQIAEEDAADRVESRLSLTPSYDYTRDRVQWGTDSSDSRSLSQTAGYDLTTGLGTKFGATAGYTNADSSLYGYKQDTYSSGLSLSQPLWRNRFGKLWDADLESKRSDRVSAEDAFEDKTLTRHLAAAELYSRTYIAERKEQVYSELLERMRKVWKQTEKDYRRKLITKLDYLSSKSNWFEMLDTQERIKTDRVKSFETLNLYTDAPWSGDLLSPATFYASNPVGPVPDLSSHPSIRVLDGTIESLKMRLRYFHEDNRPDLGLDGSVGYSHVSNAVTYTGRDDDVWTAKVGFKLAFPLDKQTDYDLKATSALIDSAIKERAEALRVLEDIWAAQSAAFAQASTRLGLNAQKLEVYALQVEEAYRKFRQGRLEFQDYLQHWERFQNAKLNRLDLESASWTAQLQLIRIAGKLPVYAEAVP